MAPNAHLWEHSLIASSIFADNVTLMQFWSCPKSSLSSVFTLAICNINPHTKYHIEMRANQSLEKNEGRALKVDSPPTYLLGKCAP